MKKLILFIAVILVATASYGVDQRYMPAGYVRDDVIFPYYVKYTNEYFNKVNSGKIKCNWGTYRQEVNAPIVKIMEQLDKEVRYDIIPKY